MESKAVTYLERLDHIRFLAAMMVLLFHTSLMFRGQHEMRQDIISIPLIDQGQTAVPLFMVISGMILAIIVNGKEIIVANFYKNRILRIYPLFIFIVALGYFAGSLHGPTSTGIDFLMSLLPISNLYRLQYGPFGGQLWSIAVELQFYLIFPFIMTLRKQYGVKYLIGCIGFLLFLRLGIYRINHAVDQLSYFTLLGNFDIFLVGIFTGEIYLSCKNKSFWWTKWYVVLVYAVAINLVLHKVKLESRSSLWVIWPTIQAILWSMFVILYLRSEIFIPGNAVLCRFGKYSYSIYIWHIFVLELIPKNQVGWMTPYALGFFVVLPLTLAVSAASYHLIEEPFLAFRIRYTRDATIALHCEPEKIAA